MEINGEAAKHADNNDGDELDKEEQEKLIMEGTVESATLYCVET